ncbi:MAG: sugar O-acetyltransferase [Prevotella sp.]|nr:sugar O-acetyltransferase [Prevotella sp.]
MTSRQIAMTEMEKMKAGLEYTYADQELIARKTQAIEWCEEYNAIDGRDYARQYECLKKMLGSVGERVWISKTFGCDCGKNIFIGNDFTGNFNLTILDIREVYIGNNVMIGPNTLITTVGHPLSPKARRGYMAKAAPVRIGNDVWLGGNVTILPGVTIGNNVVVAAGAVVNKDVPDNSLVGGVPAKLIRKIENDTENN